MKGWDLILRAVSLVSQKNSEFSLDTFSSAEIIEGTSQSCTNTSKERFLGMLSTLSSCWCCPKPSPKQREERAEHLAHLELAWNFVWGLVWLRAVTAPAVFTGKEWLWAWSCFSESFFLIVCVQLGKTQQTSSGLCHKTHGSWAVMPWGSALIFFRFSAAWCLTLKLHVSC